MEYCVSQSGVCYCGCIVRQMSQTSFLSNRDRKFPDERVGLFTKGCHSSFRALLNRERTGGDWGQGQNASTKHWGCRILNLFRACTSKQLDVMSTQSSAVTVRVQNMSARSDLIKNSAERGPSAVVLGLVDQGRRT